MTYCFAWLIVLTAFMQVDAALGDVFAYDDTDQVTGVQYDATNPDTTPSSPARTVSYGFDPVGNRTNVTDNGAGTSYTANNLNQYTAVGAASPTYDANGNLTNYLGWGYAYDAQNRLWGAANTNTSGTFTYDAKNRVVSRIVNGTTNYYFYDDWSLVQEVSAAAAVLQTYVHGPRLDEMIFKTDGSNLVYYHYDALGNVTHLTDSYSRVVERYRYDIYGKATIKDGGGNTLTATAYGNRFQFTGREYLADFGLHDYRNRVYLESWGRFIQTDPIRFDAKDVNIYRYCGNRPHLTTDPMGTDFGDVCITSALTGVLSSMTFGFCNATDQVRNMALGKQKEFDTDALTSAAYEGLMIGLAAGAGAGLLGGTLTAEALAGLLYSANVTVAGYDAAALGALAGDLSVEIPQILGETVGDAIDPWGAQKPDYKSKNELTAGSIESYGGYLADLIE